MMKHLSGRLVWLNAAWLSLCFLLLLCPGPSRSQAGFEAMDLSALAAEAEQLEARVSRNAADYATLRDLATVYHYMAVKDSKAYAKRAVERLEEASRKQPDDNVVLCFLGNAYVLLAKEGGGETDRATYVNRGFEYMDKAVRRAPEDVTVRLTRAFSAKATPKFLGRRPVAYEDFEYLAALFEKGLPVPQSLKAAVYGQLADLWGEDGDNGRAEKYRAMAQKAATR